MFRRLLAAVTLAAALSAPAGGAITYFTGGVATAIPGLTGFMTLGSEMDGLQVTACFSLIGCETRGWADTGATSGGVSGTGWAIDLTGDTFTAPWLVAIDGSVAGQILALLLDGRGAAFTIFDRTAPSPGTLGSAAGADWFSTIDADINVTFLDPTNLIGDPAVGDLYQQVLIEFVGGSGPRTDFSFRQDTDNDSRRTQVPEPGSLALLGVAAVAFGLTRRRRN